MTYTLSTENGLASLKQSGQTVAMLTRPSLVNALLEALAKEGHIVEEEATGRLLAGPLPAVIDGTAERGAHG